MEEDLIKNADACYLLAEQKAANYFKSLYIQVMQKTYIPILITDLKWWKEKHIYFPSIISSFTERRKKSKSKDYNNYIKWLDNTDRLDDYLERSISYILMRDLGKPLNTPDTEKSIQSAISSLKKHLLNSTESHRKIENEKISAEWLYRKVQEECIESTIIWLIKKLKSVTANIPEGMDAVHAQRKLIKIIAGVLMHEIEDMSDDIPPEERARKLDEAIKLGYSYGLTYPFIDDILDAKVLSDEEKQQYSDLIRTSLITGSVPELYMWTGGNIELIRYIHLELREAFEYIKARQRPDTIECFFERSYVFFYSQEIDRKKKLSYANYSNEDLYIPIILKSAYSRLIVRSVINASKDEGFDNRTFVYGIYNQLADDFADIFEDMQDNSVTPYTYYLKYHDKRSDLINPFELYWAVISNLIHNVYESDLKTCEVILARAINGLKRFKERIGTKKYNEIMGILTPENTEFNNIVQYMVQKAYNVDFFDKLLRDHIITILKKEKREQEDFLDTIEKARDEINKNLYVEEDSIPLLKEPIIDAVNYSLVGDGKRLRPILTWVIGINEYGLNKSAIVPLVRALEYMHTASLIFDDLPSQDNASTRRGRPTLHKVYNIAIAELTGLFLTQKAIEEQASLHKFYSNTVLSLIRYSAQITENMCRGQAMDLESKGKKLTLEQLNLMCFYKTGIAFEAALIMPAILAKAEDLEIAALKKFAKHAGAAFQIQDDLLDVEGDGALLGKYIGKDSENNSATFVSVLGLEGAKKELWEHYRLAMEALREVPLNTTFLKHLMNYIISRNH